MPTPEGQILKAVMAELKKRNIFFIRLNSGTKTGSHAGKKWAIHMNAPGTADLLAFPQLKVSCPAGCGRPVIAPFPVWLELKAANGKQSELQKSFQRQVEDEGHIYRVIYSIEDLEGALR